VSRWPGVDLKADHGAGVLRVPGAFAEPHAELPRVTAEPAAELPVMAERPGLDGVVVGERGDLAAGLVAAVRQRAGAVCFSGVSGSVSG
jgi:uncharacterized protein YcaQ